uniref:Uncharacterized protein n=1 Tax=Chromera velia CCMP2878 TaxID=1169474 RepID=A0A0G4FKE1_9ALVE|eukprot:Cvel_17346.t1-p1 / transcript=Cvel_17346.t1 / gene=Cvel_17346 / organism=Chromera_velia_CCMP2878 / gene_product=hypothetical protein / transcript_product=hypothetical protein / location=Cvel_scaffold1378:42044-44408(+) / protein_length=283 / sequence_SO=supercontig / SO=protein_coding / is_pseudo=false
MGQPSAVWAWVPAHWSHRVCSESVRAALLTILQTISSVMGGADGICVAFLFSGESSSSPSIAGILSLFTGDLPWVPRRTLPTDAVAILGDSDEWCSGLTLTNRNKVGVNVKHYVARTKVEVLEKVVERVPHLSSEVSEQLRIFYGHIVDCVSPPDAEWMKKYLQRTDVLRMGKAKIIEIRELLSRREKERISGRELHGGASIETKVKTEEETGVIPDTSRQMSVPVSSEQRPASDEWDRRSSSSSSSSGGVQVVGVRPDTTLVEKKRKQYEDLVAQILGLDAA